VKNPLALIFCLLWLATAVGALLILRKTKSIYRDLNALRLDPLELRRIPASQDSEPSMVFYGDSRMSQWPQPPWLSEPVVNLGISGQTTRQILDRFDENLGQLRPKVVVIHAGINDLKTIALFPDDEARIIADCSANLRLMVERSRSLGARVVISTIFPAGELPLYRRPFWSDRVDSAILEVNQTIKSFACEGVSVLDTVEALTDASGQLVPAYSRDFLHLSPEGYTQLNKALRDCLEPRRPDAR
jgi:lysophospholipase L1-like esterase